MIGITATMKIKGTYMNFKKSSKEQKDSVKMAKNKMVTLETKLEKGKIPLTKTNSRGYHIKEKNVIPI